MASAAFDNHDYMEIVKHSTSVPLTLDLIKAGNQMKAFRRSRVKRGMPVFTRTSECLSIVDLVKYYCTFLPHFVKDLQQCCAEPSVGGDEFNKSMSDISSPPSAFAMKLHQWKECDKRMCSAH